MDVAAGFGITTGGLETVVSVHKGPSINDVGNWEGEGSKIGQNCQRIVLKKCRHWGGGCQKSEKNCRRCLWMVPNST